MRQPRSTRSHANRRNRWWRPPTSPNSGSARPSRTTPSTPELNTHQRFHKLAKTPGHKPGFRKHFGAAPIHPHGNQNAGPVTNPPTVKPPTVKAPHVPFKSGPTKIGTPKKITFPIIKLTNGKGWPIWKAGPKKIWVGGKWKVFVPFASIPVVLIGGGYYWPDAYVNVGRPYCEGITPDGCHLNWQLVRFEDGGGAYQCVHYCPRPNAPPPAQAAALVAPPPVPQSGAKSGWILNRNGDDHRRYSNLSRQHLHRAPANHGSRYHDEYPRLHDRAGWQRSFDYLGHVVRESSDFHAQHTGASLGSYLAVESSRCRMFLLICIGDTSVHGDAHNNKSSNIFFSK